MSKAREHLYNLATDKYRGSGAAAAKFFLFLLSLVYGSAVRALAFFCRFFARRINCKVISVGNITLGGTGKTSLVEYIAAYLKNRGRRVAILSRGYKRKMTNDQFPISNYEMMGDEPYMLQMKLEGIPVIVGADRASAARRARNEYAADTLILDDGFQQWRIKKDLEIVTIDATNPFGNRYLLPRGILREGLSALKRADIFVLTKTNLSADIEGLKNTLRGINRPVAQGPLILLALGKGRPD